jgi:hypothetical protein
VHGMARCFGGDDRNCFSDMINEEEEQPIPMVMAYVLALLTVLLWLRLRFFLGGAYPIVFNILL